MSRPVTTLLLLLGLHLIGGPIGAIGAKLRLVNAIYNGADNLSLLEWIFDYAEDEMRTPKRVNLFFEHQDFDPQLECFLTEQRALDAHGPPSVYCVQLATVYGSDFRSKPVVPFQEGNYTFRITHDENQTVRAPVFYLDANGTMVDTTTADDDGDSLAQSTVSICLFDDIPKNADDQLPSQIRSSVSVAWPSAATSSSSEQTTEVTSQPRNDMSASEKAGIAVGAILLGSLILGMFVWGHGRTKQKNERARAPAAAKGNDHSEASELEQPEEKQVELGQPQQRVELTGGVREDRAELAAESDVYELDAWPQRWEEEDIESKDWMKNQMVGVDICVGSPRNQELNRV